MGYFPNAAFLRRTEAEVALLRLLQLQGRAFDPGVVNMMVTAFDNTLRELKLRSRHDPLVERVAQIIIECAERDARCYRDAGLRKPSATVPSIEFFFAASGAVDLEIGRAMNTEHERKHLAQADRHIAELKKDIARQWQIIEELSLGGRPLHQAISMLRLLRGHLRIMERQRQSILDKLD